MLLTSLSYCCLNTVQLLYKNVHTDVKDLLYVGLIEETEEGLLNVPWDVIISELPLLPKAKSIHKLSRVYPESWARGHSFRL